MSIVATVHGLIAHAIEHGHANEFPEPVQHVLHAIAEHVEAGGGAPADILPQLQKMLTDSVKIAFEQMKEEIGGIVETKFGELLAKAAAADKPADVPQPEAPATA